MSGGGQIGSIVGGVAGAVAGAYLGNPYLGFAIGSTLGGIIGSIIDPLKDPAQSPPNGIKDLYITSASLGQMIPIIKGAFRTSGLIIDATKKRSELVEVDSPSSTPSMKGKSGGGGNITTERTYFVSLAILLCEGEIREVTRIWADLDLWYDSTADLGKIELAEANDETITFAGVFTDDETPVAVDTMTVYRGTATAMPDATFEEYRGEGEISAYRRVAYVVFKDLALGNSGRVPNFTFEVVRDETSLDALQDILITDIGLYAIYAKGITSKRSISFDVECNITVDMDAHLSTITRVDGGSFQDDGFAVGMVTISGSAAGNNGTHIIRSVTMADIIIAGDLEVETAVDLRLAQSVRDPNALGSVVSYSLRTLNTITRKSVGVNPQSLAAINQNGGIDTIAVLNYGTQDGLDETTDTLYFFYGGLALDTFTDMNVNLRTAGEIENNDVLGSQQVVSGRGVTASISNKFFVLHNKIHAISRYEFPSLTASGGFLTRQDITDTPIFMAYAASSPTSYLYVLCAGDKVKKLNGSASGGTIPIVDTITLSAGASEGRLIVASDFRAWVSNVFASSVTHFTTNGDKVSVTVPDGPMALVEASDDFIWVASGGAATISRIDPADDSVETFSLNQIVAFLAPGLNGKVWAATSGFSSAILLIDTDGTYVEVRAPAGISKILTDQYGYCYAMSVDSRTIFMVNADATATNTILSESGLACVVRYFNERAGVPPEQIDVSGLDNTPVNMVLSEVQSARNIIEELARTFVFTATESEGALKYYFLNNIDVVAAIPENALSAGQDKQNNKSVMFSRLQERELPTQVTVVAPDVSRNYHDGSIPFQITTGNAGMNPQVVRVPYALNYQQINRLAEVHLLGPWTRRDRAEFTLPPLLRLLEPGDGFTLTARGTTRTMRFTERTLAAKWVDSARAEGYNNTIYHATEIIETPPDILLPPKIPSPAAGLILELPPLGSTDLTLKHYAAFYKTIPTRDFIAATLYRSIDSGVNYNFIGSSHDQATLGTVASALGDANPNVWDDTNVLTVVMLNGTLTSSTDLAVLNGANRALYGRELIQFVNATLIAVNTYQVSRLLRGRKGTESFVGTHVSDEYFVLLTAVITNGPISYDPALLNVAASYKIVDPVTAITAAVAFMETLDGTSVKPWAPTLRDLERGVPSSNDITFHYVARQRLYDLPIGVSATWDIDSTRTFYINIYDDNTYTTVVRTITAGPYTGSITDELTAVYTAAQQTTDFGSPQSTIYYGIQATGMVLGYEARAEG